MPCATVVGTALEFGIAEEEASLVTQSVSVTAKMDKKEARDGCGIVKSVAHYNKTFEVQIEGLGANTGALTVGGALSLAGTFGLTIAGDTYIDEITVEKSNEEFVKTSIRAMAYEGIVTP
jgi:hypothetical protein